jgi:hypothetical protein
MTELCLLEVEDVNAGARLILERTSRIEAGLKREQERRILDRLFAQVNSGGLAIVGLDSPFVRFSRDR